MNKEVDQDGTEETYADLINEAFIDPIRNVTVIDDEYPTLNSFLENTLSASQAKQENQERLQAIIKMCHQEHKWSVDVYDGQEPKLGKEDNGYTGHINHSDLIILDYHLDGQPGDDNGGRAREIINHLSENNHFNLIIIHTKGYKDDIEKVFTDILKEFVCLEDFNILFAEGMEDKIVDYLDENDPEGTAFPIFNLERNLIELLKAIEIEGFDNIQNPNNLFHSAKCEISTIATGTGLDQSEIVRFRMYQQLKDKLDTSHPRARHKIEWDYKDSVNYIATGRVFLTVTLKEDEEPVNKLYDTLREALRSQDASPMMLLMAKMRHELDEKGLEQASQIIENRYAQAGWLFNLLENATNSTSEHHQAITLHWEQLAAASKEPLVNFSERLVKTLQRECLTSRGSVKRYFKECIGETVKALAHLNVYSCSKRPATPHLTTGTILQCEDKKYWICLSPACDLVPGRERKDWQDRIGDDFLAFQTIQLIEDDSSLSKANQKSTSNEYIFLQIEGDIRHLRFSDGNPIWETFYAENKGTFTNGGGSGSFPHMLKVKTLRYQNNELESVEIKMTVIAELRYEYALNLLQKFGSNQTRVGLGFVKELW